MKVVYRWLKKGIYESHPALAELRLLGALFVYVGTMVDCMTALLVWRITSRIQNADHRPSVGGLPDEQSTH